MRTLRTPASRAAGFSLIELLVVIAVIGIITAIVIPALTNIREQARFAKDQRNAQAIANVAAQAVAAGYKGEAWNSVDTVISSLSDGGHVEVGGSGSNPGMQFSVSELGSEDTVNLYKFLSFEGPTTVTYNPAGTNPPPSSGLIVSGT